MKSIKEIQKDLLRNKTNAIFQYYAQGKLYYNIKLEEGEYQFPISILVRDAYGMKLSEEIGVMHVESSFRASHWMRWIEKAINNDEFIPLFDVTSNSAVMEHTHSREEWDGRTWEGTK